MPSLLVHFTPATQRSSVLPALSAQRMRFALLCSATALALSGCDRSGGDQGEREGKESKQKSDSDSKNSEEETEQSPSEKGSEESKSEEPSEEDSPEESSPNEKSNEEPSDSGEEDSSGEGSSGEESTQGDSSAEDSAGEESTGGGSGGEDSSGDQPGPDGRDCSKIQWGNDREVATIGKVVGRSDSEGYLDKNGNGRIDADEKTNTQVGMCQMHLTGKKCGYVIYGNKG